MINVFFFNRSNFAQSWSVQDFVIEYYPKLMIYNDYISSLVMLEPTGMEVF